MKAKKSLGQNFLTDESVPAKMIEVAGVLRTDNVLEIGPGRGFLTRVLMREFAHVWAIEADAELIPKLTAGYDARRLSVIYGDVMELDIDKLVSLRKLEPYHIIANIPYYITGKLLRKLLSLEQVPKSIVLMVQKEVAERITAPVGQMSLLAISVQYLADAEYCFTVTRDKFDPSPKVDSAVVRIVPHDKIPSAAERKRFFGIVRAGFGAKRKTLVNNLSVGLSLSKSEITEILRKLELSPTIRAQELSISDWQRLVNVID